ncbi:MAG: DUF2914 domain-containing protein [Desulfobacteraceae bacterium]|nr:MAG: DUF2914 domain-containing protein [Desulfobacteraceae bacterium]
MRFIRRIVIGLIAAVAAIGYTGNAGFCDPKEPSPAAGTADKLTVVRAQICEEMNNLQPVNPTAVFSVAKDKAFCFAEIDGIGSSTQIFHNWIRRDNHVAGIKLVVKPPRWSTVSSISLRETDKGPWRVEIADMDGNVLKTLRFSVVD